MSKTPTKPLKSTRPSLTQLFDPPEGFTGHFGWLCGYSADALFLNSAAERFTGQTEAQRAHQGNVSLAVFLDSGNANISLLDAPGVAHLLRNREKEFRLLHAKVALLGFQHSDGAGWCIRLIVSTGNWTRQTLEESLDLAWCVDVKSTDLSQTAVVADNDFEIRRRCADVKAAQNLMQKVNSFFNDDLLNISKDALANPTKLAKDSTTDWIAQCSAKAKGPPRFFDSQKRSLLSQLIQQVKNCKEVGRNYLAMGSGFYEASGKPGQLPKVPKKIVDALRKGKLLTNTRKLDIYVNPDACQSVAGSIEALIEQGFTVRKAAQPASVFGEVPPRTLHAKFLFSANLRDNSDICNSAWVYLGSGNLTSAGFTKKMSANSGNLEAGVVFPTGSLHWETKRADTSKKLVTDVLPIQWNQNFVSNENKLTSGERAQARDDVISPPVTFLEWFGSELRIPAMNRKETCEITVLDAIGNAIIKTKTGFPWAGIQPRLAQIIWKAGVDYKKADIPVVDQYGRIAATVLRSLDLDEAWWQLANFPAMPDDEELSSDNAVSQSSIRSNGGVGVSLKSPIRQMMQLVENIAAKQTNINQSNWTLWCNRLQQNLIQMKECQRVAYFQKLGINPLSPLWAAPFRPSFAETDASPEGEMYEKALVCIADAWKVSALKTIGRGKKSKLKVKAKSTGEEE